MPKQALECRTLAITKSLPDENYIRQWPFNGPMCLFNAYISDAQSTMATLRRQTTTLNTLMAF